MRTTRSIGLPATTSGATDVPPLTPAWPGKLFSWTVIGGENHQPREFAFKPWPQQPVDGELEMWRYRRIVDTGVYQHDGKRSFPDVALINMVQMDYFQAPMIDVTRQQRDIAFAEAREQSLCFLYWMQTEAPRFDGTDGVGFPGLKLRGDELGTADGFAKHPYIREARRLDALRIVTEADVGAEQRRRDGRPGQDASPVGMGECFPDGVGIGHYRLDLHPSTALRNSVYAQATPFRIPLGALIPKRLTNLLAAGKCLGVTHVTNGAYRLHPVEWNVGESAGALAAYCIDRNTSPRAVREDVSRLRDFQRVLTALGIPLAWPWEKSERL
ncbi:MAG: FAD-dependent oxidoreductase [Tepidisphaeraceae bacterium]